MGQNNLYPVFIKLETLHTLVVGAGNVGFEKLSTILKNSPGAKVTVVADIVCDDVADIINNNSYIKLLKRKFFISDLEGIDLLILATDNASLHKRIKAEARKRKILTNVADAPALCDFFLGSVVQKDDLKIAISTNGKSPTFAKRFREFIEELLPDGVQELLENLNTVRNNLVGDFQYKVKVLNDLTSSFNTKSD